MPAATPDILELTAEIPVFLVQRQRPLSQGNALPEGGRFAHNLCELGLELGSQQSVIAVAAAVNDIDLIIFFIDENEEIMPEQVHLHDGLL